MYRAPFLGPSVLLPRDSATRDAGSTPTKRNKGVARKGRCFVLLGAAGPWFPFVSTNQGGKAGRGGERDEIQHKKFGSCKFTTCVLRVTVQQAQCSLSAFSVCGWVEAGSEWVHGGGGHTVSGSA